MRKGRNQAALGSGPVPGFNQRSRLQNLNKSESCVSPVCLSWNRGQEAAGARSWAVRGQEQSDSRSQDRAREVPAV